jgi:hypothetical protein
MLSKYDEATGTIVETSRWLFDSGANINVTNERTRLNNYRGTKTIKGVEDAAGRVHQVVGVGECMMEVQCGANGARIFRIEKVLHVPTFAMSIVSESWARSAGFGYEAPPTRSWNSSCKIKRYDADGKVDIEFKLATHEGLNFIEGRAVKDATAPILNYNETKVETRQRQDRRKLHCNLSTAANFKEFEKRCHDTNDVDVLSDMLGGHDDEGFEEATPRLTAPMKMQVKLRLADLGVLCTENAALSPFFVLHHKLGHGGMLETCRAARDLGIKLPRIEDRWCDACIRAGLTRRPMVKELRDRSALAPYEKVFTDIAGPFPERSAYNGYTYLIGFICAKTHEGTIYGMHSLNDVKACTEKYLSWIRNQRVTGQVEVTSVRDGVYDPIGYTTLQTDSHSVYRSDEFKALVENRFKASLQHSPPYEQHKNGMIERYWRTIGCRARAMLIAGKCPNNYWFWAYQQAARCHNLLGTSANDGRKSPFEAKLGRKPTDKMKQLRSFGADCYLWESSPGKLGEHGRCGKWVGFDDQNISYRVYFPKEKGHAPKIASMRQGQHIVMKDEKLPNTVLSGEIGMVFPEYEPFSLVDDLEVDIPSDKEIALGQNGGVAEKSASTPRGNKHARDSKISNSTTNSKAISRTTNGNVVENGGVAAQLEKLDGLKASDLSDISDEEEFSEDDTDMLMTDDVDMLVDDQIEVNSLTEEPQYSMSDTMSVRRGTELGTRVRKERVRMIEEDTGKKASKRVKWNDQRTVGKLTTSEPSVKFPTSTRRSLPQRKRIEIRDVGDIRLSVNKARWLACAGHLANDTAEGEFPIGKLHFDCRKALKSPKYGEQFKASIKKEMDAINKFKVMKPILRSDIPKDTKLFNSYMICHRKSLGHPDWKCKSRLVIDGSNTTPGVHTMEMDISTSLPRWNAVRMLLATAKGKGHTIKAADVSTAFLKGRNSGITVYMRMPMGMRQYETDRSGVRQEVLMAVEGNLYGKADAPRNFELAMWEFYKGAGFEQDPHEKSLWVRGLGTKHEVVAVNFCDDIIVSANCEAAHVAFDAELTKRWGDCGMAKPKYILGCDVVQTSTSIRLTASSKIRELLEDLKLTDCTPKDTPFPHGTQVDIRDCPKPEDKIKMPFRSVLGKLQYIQYACRPTIAHNISQLARVQNNPAPKHWKLLIHVVKYLKGTVDAGVEYRMQPRELRNRLVAYSDASWADLPGGIGDPTVVDGKKSTLGHVLMLNGGPVSWKAHVSQIVALSSAEAELFATVACAKDICEARRLLAHVGEPQEPTPSTLWCDSSSVVSINSKRNTSAKLRHIEIKYFYCRYLAEAGVISTRKIDGDENVSDLFTKALGETKFRKFALMLEQGQTSSWSKQVMYTTARAMYSFGY